MGSGSSFDNVSQYHKGQGGELGADSELRQMVNVGAVSSGVTIPVTMAVSASYTHLQFSNSAGGSSSTQLLASPGSGTYIQVRGFSLFNAGATLRRVQLRFGGDTGAAFYDGGLAADGGNFNWNMINQYVEAATNKAVTLWLENDTTVVATMYYKEV
jgi:hypothetical protein